MRCAPRAEKWQVEAVSLDGGDGLRRWFAVHASDTVTYLATAAEVQDRLAAQGRSGADLLPLDEGLPDGEDGCE